MKKCTIFLLFSLFSVGFSQQLFSLSHFDGGNTANELRFPLPYSIYVSAYSDDNSLLSKIFIVSDDEGTKTSLFNLKDNRFPNNIGELKRYIVQKSSYLTTELTTNQMKTLTGVIFMSTPNQVADNNFHVYDVVNSQNIQFQGLGPINSTILFLNTFTNYQANSAVISNWQQKQDASVFIYPGYPVDSIEPKDTQIFSNPVDIDKLYPHFFSTVEQFSLTMVAFYLKTYKGVNFTIKQGYYNIDKTTTSAYTTTGFYMKPKNRIDMEMTIITKRDEKYSGTTGVNVLGYLSYPTLAEVIVTENGGPCDDQFSAAPNDFIISWSTPNIGENLTISSSPPAATGYFYVQYFVLQGPLNPSTTCMPGGQTTAKPEGSITSTTTSLPGQQTTANPVNSTWHYVETITKSSRKVQILISLIISFMIFIGFY